ncbi:RNA polymerase sigma factor [Chitinophaga rhizophila]|uniref:RNA polymerase sigma factor n=1 Tax=Chitinophaga rhizophila TaxID=2866212 RepID=A0ABS7G743_9BACT|nr:RNA polymerase sigma factor [Chitinophaga rhizophila]MBW8683478.1 RNA polymerase sigma factor [Chitinophaga rhizophila]
MTHDEHQVIKEFLGIPSKREMAFSLLYRLLKPRLFALAYRKLNEDFQSAEDVVQDTFFKFCSMQDYQSIEKLDSWLFKTMLNLIENKRDKHRRRSKELDLIIRNMQHSYTYQGDLEHKIDLSKATANLTATEMACFEVMFVAGHNSTSAADILQVHRTTCTRNLNQALAKIRCWLF